ncbi:hypothetical protein [Catenulispora sp. GP43]
MRAADAGQAEPQARPHPDPEHRDLDGHRDPGAESAANHGCAASVPPPGS